MERAVACAIASGDMPLFRDDESRASDPGNRCKLRFRHALLMSLIRKKDNPTQGTLQAIFGVDQTSVCRYLKVMDRILASVLPTAKNVSKEIAACKTKEEFKRMVPGPGGGDVTADGTHCPVQRPSEKTIRRMIYSGKKKRFTYNTNVYTNADGVVIGISRSSVGSTGDITLLREDPMPFGKWAESMARRQHTRRRQDPHLGRPGLPGNRQRSARRDAYDPPQEVQEPPDSDCRAEGAQPLGQLHPSARRALHRKAQAATRAWQTRTTEP